MIKYLGSKRRLVPVLGAMLDACGARTALDLFTGTTRVAQEFKRRGAHVTAVDTASYAEVFARCWIELDAATADRVELRDALAHLNTLTGEPGYFTEAFCVRARYLQPFNGARVDAIREAIESDYRATWLHPVLLTALLLAADRVDSTTGLQMAYLKEWAERSYRPLQLLAPDLIDGDGRSIRADAREVVGHLPRVDLAYLDPPYNQHRYFTNYHVWETLVRWDQPQAYGVAMKRIDSRDDATKSPFNSKRLMPGALREVIAAVDCELMLLSYNNESWLTRDELIAACAQRGHVEILDVASRRYIGAQIGIYSPSGQRVGDIGHLRNVEHLVIAGDRDLVRRVAEAGREAVDRIAATASTSSRTAHA
ncbi:MAG: DNA adenine methylase [Actinomycetales bacterium]